MNAGAFLTLSVVKRSQLQRSQLGCGHSLPHVILMQKHGKYFNTASSRKEV